MEFGKIREHFHEREYAVLEELQRLAEPHVQASNGLFRLLPVEPESFPAQSLLKRRVPGAPQDIGVVELIATGVEQRFPAFTDKLHELETDHGEISRLGELLKEDQNIILVTNHGDIKDIAYTLAAYYIKLKELDYQDFHTGLVMSKIISFIGVGLGEHVDPAVNILKNVCDDEYFSFPRTRSIAESKIASQLVDTYNRRVRKSMDRQLNRGKNLFAMAASGTTDKPLVHDPDTISLGPISPGTAKLMMTENSLVVPVAVWLTKDSILFEPCDIPRAIKSQDEAHSVMDKIAHHLTERVGRNFLYAHPARSVGGVAVQNY
jgi:hypothetical protein